MAPANLIDLSEDPHSQVIPGCVKLTVKANWDIHIFFLSPLTPLCSKSFSVPSAPK